MTTKASSSHFSWFLFWAYSFFMVQAAVVPPRFIPRFITLVNDKWVHSVEYFLAFAVAANAFRRAQPSFLSRRTLTAAFLYALGMGAFTEFLQSLTPYRQPQFSDWLADAAGALAALFLIKVKRMVRGAHEIL